MMISGPENNDSLGAPNNLGKRPPRFAIKRFLTENQNQLDNVQNSKEEDKTTNKLNTSNLNSS